MTEDTNEDLETKIICPWHKASRVQRDDELMRGDGFEGTKGYKDRGCYSCDGYDYLRRDEQKPLI